MSKMSEDVLPWILKYQTSAKWYNSLQSEETKRVYSLRFKQYCDAVGKNPDELIAFKIEGLKNVGSKTEFQAEDLFDSTLSNFDLT